MNTWKRTSNTQGSKKRLLVGGLILGLVSLCNGMGHSKLIATDLHPTQAGMGRRGNIFAQLTTRQLDSGSKKLNQQDAAPLSAPEASTEAKYAEPSAETERAAKVEQAVNAITEELSKSRASDQTSTSAPVTNSEGVIPQSTQGPNTQVEKAADAKSSDSTEDFIDFTPQEDRQDEDVHTSTETHAVEGANNAAVPGALASNDQNNNSGEGSLEL